VSVTSASISLHALPQASYVCYCAGKTKLISVQDLSACQVDARFIYLQSQSSSCVFNAVLSFDHIARTPLGRSCNYRKNHARNHTHFRHEHSRTPTDILTTEQARRGERLSRTRDQVLYIFTADMVACVLGCIMTPYVILLG